MTILYEKVGRRYHPVHDTAAMDGLCNGTWLVTVVDGRRSVCRGVDATPAMAKLAATRRLADIIARAIQTHSAYTEGRGSDAPLTRKERRAYDAFKEIMGPGAMVWFTRPAAQTVADEAARMVIEECSKP